MKIEKGMYARTKDLDYYRSRIVKIINVNQQCVFYNDKGIMDNQIIDVPYIKKTSFNIIDLIEVGDYVNGGRVKENLGDCICLDYNPYNEYGETECDMCFTITPNEIKGVLTKEQFENCEFRIKEEE